MSYHGSANPTILVPTDFSECSEPAVTRALELARALGGSAVLLYIVDTMPMMAAADVPLLWTQLIDDLRADSETRMSELAKRLGVSRYEVIEGRPAFAIVDAAERLKADLIVMGTHGRGGFSRFFLGSVADRVVRTAPCDVLVVRAEIEKKAKT